MSKILEQRLKQVEYARNVWAVTPESATKFEDVLSPAYWSHVARTIQKGDRIEILPADQSYFAELYVLSRTDNEVRVAVLRKVELVGADASSPASTGDYDVKHRGGAGWSVIRKVDKAVMFEKGNTRAEAESWLAARTDSVLA